MNFLNADKGNERNQDALPENYFSVKSQNIVFKWGFLRICFSTIAQGILRDLSFTLIGKISTKLTYKTLRNLD